MDNQVAKYNELSRKLNNSFRASTREPSQLRTIGNETLTTNVRNINMRSPIYDAEKTKHPLQYLKSMKSYINASNLDHEEMLYVLSQSLQGTASTWWQNTSQSINEYDDFEKKFKARYWSQSEQRECARNWQILSKWETNKSSICH